jgi:hypothetical protein
MKFHCGCIVFGLFILLSGCAHIHNFKIKDAQDGNKPPVDLSFFFKANGFVHCTSKDPDNYAEWAKTYKGGWTFSDEPVSITPDYKGSYNGHVSACEYWKDGFYWISISSCSREMESDCVSDNLKVWLLKETPEVDVTYDSDFYLDMLR